MGIYSQPRVPLSSPLTYPSTTIMTEYDYSPEAVERYYEKQKSIARWVDKQAYEASNYGNPFVPDPPSRSTSGGSSSSGRHGGYRNGDVPRSISHVDSVNLYPRPATAHGHRSGHRSSYSTNNASSPTLAPNGQVPHRYSSGSSSQSHSRSHSQTPTHRRPPPSRSQTYAHAHGASTGQPVPSLPVRSATLPAHLQSQQPGQPHYTAAPGQTVVMQNGRQTYVVVPPHNTRVQICVRISILYLFISTHLPFPHFVLPSHLRVPCPR